MVDVLTVVVSAGTSAAVSWLVAPHLANRQERGRVRGEAREEMRSIVGPVMTKVRRYQLRDQMSVGREDGTGHVAGDLTLCGTLVAAASRLPWWRRQLVRRRLIRLFGATSVDLCGLHGPALKDPSAALGIMLAQTLKARKDPTRFDAPSSGEFDRALRTAPESQEIVRLLRSLKRLQESR